MYILTVKACQRFGAGNRKSTGEIDHRGLRYELVPVSNFGEVKNELFFKERAFL